MVDAYRINAGDTDRGKQSGLVLIGILALAVVLRLIRLGTFAYWHDEAYSMLVSQNLYGFIFHDELAANHPPFAYFLLAGWRALGMEINAWTVRGLPALFGVLGVAAIFFLGKALFNTRTGLIAAFLLAISPFQILHSQDLKEYIYLPFFATVMVLYFYRATITKTRRDWITYGVLAGICCYTEAFVAPLLVAINCWFLLFFRQHKESLKYWFIANVLGALLYLPWLGMMLQKVHLYLVQAEGWWVPAPTLWSVLFYFKTIAFGYAAVKPFFHLAFFLFLILFLYGIYQALKTNQRGTFLLLFWAVLPVAMVYAISLIGQSVFLIRAMLPYAIAVYVLVAAGLAQTKNKLVFNCSMAAIVVLCSVGLGAHYLRIMHPLQHPHRPGIHPPQEYDKAAAYVLQHVKEEDIVIHASAATWLPFYWYGFRGQQAQYSGAHNAAFNDIIRTANPVNSKDPELLRLWPEMMETLVADHQRIWFIFSEWERGFLHGQAMNVYRWLDSRYQEVERTRFMGMDIIVYLTPEHPEARRTLSRDHDTGVTAELRYEGWESAYTKVIPDANLVPQDINERMGNLVVKFADAPPLSGDSGKETDASQIAFEVSNVSNTPSEFTIHVMNSDALVPCSAFNRKELELNEWNYTNQYASPPPPVSYNLWALSGAFSNTSASVQYRGQLPGGDYMPLLFAVAPLNVPEFLIAPIEVVVNASEHSTFPEKMRMDTPRWAWIVGEPFSQPEDRDLEIDIRGYPSPDVKPVYANLGYLAFINRNHLRQDLAPGDVLEPWISNTVIAPGESKVLAAPVHPESLRVDVWVYETGETGSGYHIFKMLK